METWESSANQTEGRRTSILWRWTGIPQVRTNGRSVQSSPQPGSQPWSPVCLTLKGRPGGKGHCKLEAFRDVLIGACGPREAGSRLTRNMAFYKVTFGAYWPFFGWPRIRNGTKSGKLAVIDQSWPPGQMAAECGSVSQSGCQSGLAFVCRVFSLTTCTASVLNCKRPQNVQL